MAKVVLVVEDEETLRRLIVSLLRMRGILILEAENGQAAEKIARERLPDLIISDMNMPDGDGLWLAENLQKTEATSRIPILLMTGGSHSVTARSPSIVGCVIKPFDAEEFLGVVSEALKKTTRPDCS